MMNHSDKYRVRRKQVQLLTKIPRRIARYNQFQDTACSRERRQFSKLKVRVKAISSSSKYLAPSNDNLARYRLRTSVQEEKDEAEIAKRKKKEKRKKEDSWNKQQELKEAYNASQRVSRAIASSRGEESKRKGRREA